MRNFPPEETMMNKAEFDEKFEALCLKADVGATALAELGPLVVYAAGDKLIATDTQTARQICGKYAGIDANYVPDPDASRMRQLTRLGWHRHGADVCDRAVRFHGNAPKGSLLPLFTGLVNVARLQLKSEMVLSDEAIETALAKPTRKVKPEPKAKPVSDDADKLIEQLMQIAAKDASVKAKIEDALAKCGGPVIPPDQSVGTMQGNTVMH